MSVDYDLIIIGATVAGETAAIAAAASYARVAWVLESTFVPEATDCFAKLATLYRSGYSQKACQAAIPWLLEKWNAQHSLAELHSLGVDVIIGGFQFQTTPSLCLEVDPVLGGSRRLRSRTYLLALQPKPLIPSHTVAALWQTFSQLPQHQWPKRIACLGNSPQAAALSDALNQLGCQVGWVNGMQSTLPTEDPNLVFWLQTHLEARGVVFATTEVPIKIEPLPTGVTLQLGHSSLEVDAIVVFPEGESWIKSEQSAVTSPDIEKADLAGLSALNLRWQGRGLEVNGALRTSYPHIYACGVLLGGYDIACLARYEAEWAVQNALFSRKTTIDYRAIPYAITSHTARVGFTEQQALAYDATAQVIQFPMLDSQRFSDRADALQFCKVMVQPQGFILGVHLAGEAATELSYLFAAAIQQNASLASLAMHPLIHPVVAQWQYLSQKPERDRLERQFYRQRRG